MKRKGLWAYLLCTAIFLVGGTLYAVNAEQDIQHSFGLLVVGVTLIGIYRFVNTPPEWGLFKLRDRFARIFANTKHSWIALVGFLIVIAGSLIARKDSVDSDYALLTMLVVVCMYESILGRSRSTNS